MDVFEEYFQQMFDNDPQLEAEVGKGIVEVIQNWESKMDPLYGPEATP